MGQGRALGGSRKASKRSRSFGPRSRWRNLGDEAYEIRVTSLLLLGDLLPYHGEVAEAEKVFETVVSLCERHGNQGHLMWPS